MGERLFDVPEKRRIEGCTDLVPLDRERCPDCGSDLGVITLDEPALVRHGGYGATRQTITVHCLNEECRWFLRRSVTETNPRLSNEGGG
jgi:hypothetical protein